MVNRCLKSILLVLVFLLTGCENPIYQGAADISELQSVWQYLSVYSIYQERVASNPLSFRTPEALFESIGDSSYTRYRYRSRFSSSPRLQKVRFEETVTYEFLNATTAYVKIFPAFETSTYSEFRNILWRIIDYPNIVIDLRDNDGGFLNVTDSIIELFVGPGVSYIKNRYRKYCELELKGYTVPETGEWQEQKTSRAQSPALEGKNFSVLINRSTASAAEILAAALKDCLDAHLVGDTTYGKGIGQIRVPRLNRDSIQITFMKIRGVSERTGDYHNRGIEPDTIPRELQIVPKRQDGSYDLDLYYAAKLLDPTVEITDPGNWPRSPYVRAAAYRESGLVKVSPHDPITAR